MEKRQNRILNQSGMQALSPTHGVNIAVGYFTRQQPHDYEFAMHTFRHRALGYFLLSRPRPPPNCRWLPSNLVIEHPWRSRSGFTSTWLALDFRRTLAVTRQLNRDG